MARAWTTMAAAWLACAAGAGCGSALVAEGDAALAARDYERAESRYAEARAQGEGEPAELDRKLAEARTGAAAAHRARAEAHEAAGRWTEAFAAWDAARRYAGNDRALRGLADGAPGRAAQARSAEADAAAQAGDWDRAAVAAEAASGFAPQDGALRQRWGAVLVQRATAAMARQDHAAAGADFARAAELDPQNAEARAGRDAHVALEARVADLLAQAQAHEGRDEYVAAVAAYDAALAAWPGEARATERKRALEATKRFLDAFREGVAELAAERWDAAIAKFEEAGRHKSTDLLLQKRDEAHRSKWGAKADGALAAGNHDDAVNHLEQAQRYAAPNGKEWNALGARIRSVQRDKWMRRGKAHEANREWKQAARVYERVKADFADVADDELNERILAVEGHLVRVRCELCQGQGTLPKYRFEGDRQIPAGTESCGRCEGTGTDVQVKQGH
jgi:tetratricopeptide (TPR) repeat protein